MRAGWTLVAALVVVAAMGCAGEMPGRPSRATRARPTLPADHETVHDLPALFPEAMLHAFRPTIDVGTPAARGHLLDGWLDDETDASGRTVVWSSGRTSSLSLFLGPQLATPLTFRAFTVDVPGAPPQVVTIALNGTVVGEMTLTARDAQYVVEAPSVAIRGFASNQLQFSCAWSGRPADALPASKDTRELAWALDGIHVGGYFKKDVGAPRVAGQTLVIEPGSAIVYGLDIPAGALLVWNDITPVFACLNVDLEPIGAESRSLQYSETGANIVDLGLQAPLHAKLSFTVCGTATVTLHAPRITARAATKPVSTHGN